MFHFMSWMLEFKLYTPESHKSLCSSYRDKHSSKQNTVITQFKQIAGAVTVKTLAKLTTVKYEIVPEFVEQWQNQ